MAVFRLQGELLGLVLSSPPHSVLKCPQEAGEDVVVLQLLTKDQSFHAEKEEDWSEQRLHKWKNNYL